MSFTGKILFSNNEKEEFHFLIKGISPLSKNLLKFNSDIWKLAEKSANYHFYSDSIIEFYMDKVQVLSHNKRVKVVFNLLDGKIYTYKKD